MVIVWVVSVPVAAAGRNSGAAPGSSLPARRPGRRDSFGRAPGGLDTLFGVGYNSLMQKLLLPMDDPTLAAGMRLQRAIVALLRRFEYRDRSEICCHGISVAQCHTLEAVVEQGEPTMGELAARLFVSVSTMTRLVDGLERQGLVERKLDLKDRRAWRVLPTAAGRALADRIRGELAAGAAAVLAKIEEQHRESVIFAVEELTRAVDAWRSAATAEGGCCGETST